MGERITPECDIFKTLQPKGLRHITLVISDDDQDEATSDSGKTELRNVTIACGAPGLRRLLRKVDEATRPPKQRGASDA